MEHVSQLMRDQMEHPLDRAVYWIEYVIRHQGAPHLRPPAVRRSIHERGLLDVTLILIVLFLCSSAMSAYLWVMVATRCAAKRSKDDVITTKRKKKIH